MNKKLLLLSLVFTAPHINAMDEPQFPCDLIRFTTKLPELNHRIFKHTTNNSYEKPLQETAKTIQCYTSTCKSIYQFFNDQHNCLQLIKDLSEIFHYSNEKVARALKMPIARLIFYRQHSLKKECNGDFSEDMLNFLKKDFADLNFTYGDDESIYTPLIISLNQLRYTIDHTKWLLENDASIYLNGDPIVQSTCDSVMTWAAIPYFLKHHNYNGNKQDKNGNTLLIYFAEYLSPLIFQQQTIDIAYSTMKQILQAGVNPEIKNNLGKTALMYLERQPTNYAKIIKLIENAIPKKHRKKHLTIK